MTSESKTDAPVPEAKSLSALDRLKEQFLARWDAFPDDAETALDDLLEQALEQALQAEPEVITVMNPVSRPQRLLLGVLATDAGLDRMYRREWAELSVSTEGCCYLVYRRRGDSPYAIEWSHATTLPETMLNVLPDVLVLAVLQSDRQD